MEFWNCHFQFSAKRGHSEDAVFENHSATLMINSLDKTLWGIVRLSKVWKQNDETSVHDLHVTIWTMKILKTPVE